MKLFTRRVVMGGAPPSEMLGFATDMRAYVSEKTGREISLWSVMFGAPLGTMTYSARVEGIADLQQMTATLMADKEYHAKLAKGTHMVAAPAEDWLMQPIHGDFGDPPPVGTLVGITSAQIANGAYADAFAWGVDMAIHVETITGMATTFAASEFGPFGSVAWFGGTMDPAVIDSANGKLMTDSDYMKKLGAAGDLFLPGSGQQVLVARVA
jgi:hypothetical protein